MFAPPFTRESKKRECADVCSVMQCSVPFIVCCVDSEIFVAECVYYLGFSIEIVRWYMRYGLVEYRCPIEALTVDICTFVQ